MEIGTEEPAIVIEPIETPVPSKETAPDPEPLVVPEEVPVEEPEKVPA